MIELKSESLKEKFYEYAAICLKKGFTQDEENKMVPSVIEAIDKNEVGVCILGNPGSGKTILFELLSEIVHPQRPEFFIKLRTRDVVLRFNNEGHSVFAKWQKLNVLFDDLGAEEKGHYYAERPEVFERFIQDRYELFKNFGIKTHFTSNLKMDEILNRYGLRCKSRLQEMCDIIVIGGASNYTDRRSYRNFVEFPKVAHKRIKTAEDIQWEETYRKVKEEAKNAPKNTEIIGAGQRLKQRMGIADKVDNFLEEKLEQKLVIEFSQLPKTNTEGGVTTVNHKGIDLSCSEYIAIRKKELNAKEPGSDRTH